MKQQRILIIVQSAARGFESIQLLNKYVITRNICQLYGEQAKCGIMKNGGIDYGAI